MAFIALNKARKLLKQLPARMKDDCFASNRVLNGDVDGQMGGQKNERPAGYPTGLSYHIPVRLYLSHLSDYRFTTSFPFVTDFDVVSLY
jgi:hypothetical protein